MFFLKKMCNPIFDILPFQKNVYTYRIVFITTYTPLCKVNNCK